MENYRHIFLINKIAKVFETINEYHLKNYLNHFNVLIKGQFYITEDKSIDNWSK